MNLSDGVLERTSSAILAASAIAWAHRALADKVTFGSGSSSCSSITSRVFFEPGSSSNAACGCGSGRWGLLELRLG